MNVSSARRVNWFLNSIGQYHPDIVVVSEKGADKSNTGNSTQEELNKLQYVPLFYPILKNSIELKEDRLLFNIDPESVSSPPQISSGHRHLKSTVFPFQVVKLCEILRTHLNLCAFNVTKDQDAISLEIKHVSCFWVEWILCSWLVK